jgi:cyclopropane-fatty-acyl-phospholipid synthase
MFEFSPVLGLLQSPNNQMNILARSLAFSLESLVYGPSYGTLQFLIRSPRPLDPEWTWKFITNDVPAPIQWIRTTWPPWFLRNLLVEAKMRQDHVLGISHHYDVSNDFYELFLDEKYMFYSCADFPTGRETLEEAQTIKANFILGLIDPKPGEKILELGCGWGSMLRRIYEHTGDKENLFGYTVSQQQFEHIRARHGFNVEFRNFITSDYPQNHFDKIYSIGAWEHVRPKEIPLLASKLYGALKPGGTAVHHFFCRPNEIVPASYPVAQIFFPGSKSAPYRHQVRSFEAAGFRVAHQSIHDYRDTLRHWFQRLIANRDRAIELVGVRTYNRYLVFFAASWRYFQEVTAFLLRIKMVKPQVDAH